MERWKPTPEESKRLCFGVVLQAIHDLFKAPSKITRDPRERIRYERRRRAREVESNRRTAREFFFDPDSPFEWMCEGLEVNVDLAREALREEIRAGRVIHGYLRY